MRYIHWRDDFSITESFSTGQASAPVPQRVRIEYFTAKGHGRFVAERNGNTFVNCELSADGNSLVVHVSLRDKPIGHGRLLRIATVITEDANFPGGLKYTSIPDKVAAVLYFGKSDGPLDMASEIVFDGVDRLSLLEDVKLSGPDIGDLLSWNGADWVNIPRSAVAPDLSYYVRWTDLPDYVTVSDLQEILADLITSDEITSLSQRITALEQVQFFELDGNGNVKLKDEYGGLWASGWIAAGGVGTGSGGGGGASALYDLVDVSVDGRKQGDLLTYNGSHWVNMERSSLLSDYYTKSQVDTLLSNIDLDGLLTSITTQEDGTLDFTWNNGDVTKVDLTHRHLDLESAIASLRIWIDDGQGNLTLDTTKYSNLWIPGWIAAGGVGSGSGGSGGASAFYDLVDVSVDGRKQGDLLVYDGTHWINIPQSSIVPSVSISFGDLTDHPTTLEGYGITDAALASDLTKLATRVNSIEDWFEVVMVDGTPALHAKSGRAIYSDSWIAAGGVGSSSSGGSSVSWGTVSGNTVNLSVEGDEKTLLLSGALSGYATETWVMNKYLPLSGGTLTGDLRLKPSSKNFGSTLRFGDGDYAYIKEDTDDHLYFYASKGIKLETGNDYDITLNGVDVSDIVTLSGEQTITGAKTFSEFIDIGNARLMYDSVANALHVTKRTGGTVTPVGLYADGFVAAGGTGSGSNGLDDTVTQNSSYPVKSSGIYSFVTARRWVGSQAQYDALGSYDNNVEYLITEEDAD